MFVAPLVLVSSLVAQTPAPPAAPSSEVVAEAYLLFTQGRTLEGHDDVTGATAAYRKAIQLLPNSAELHAELAGLLARQGRGNEAVTEASAALKLEPANREANRTLGLVQSQMADAAAD